MGESVKCSICGQQLSMDAFHKRKSRRLSDADVCKDCRDLKKAPKRQDYFMHPVLGWIWCIPYSGQLDDNWNPIDLKGKPHMPGMRICGKKDCVRKDHVIPPEVETPASSKVLTGATDERGQ